MLTISVLPKEIKSLGMVYLILKYMGKNPTDQKLFRIPPPTFGK